MRMIDNLYLLSQFRLFANCCLVLVNRTSADPDLIKRSLCDCIVTSSLIARHTCYLISNVSALALLGSILGA